MLPKGHLTSYSRMSSSRTRQPAQGVCTQVKAGGRGGAWGSPQRSRGGRGLAQEGVFGGHGEGRCRARRMGELGQGGGRAPGAELRAPGECWAETPGFSSLGGGGGPGPKQVQEKEALKKPHCCWDTFTHQPSGSQALPSNLPEGASWGARGLGVNMGVTHAP